MFKSKSAIWYLVVLVILLAAARCGSGTPAPLPFPEEKAASPGETPAGQTDEHQEEHEAETGEHEVGGILAPVTLAGGEKLKVIATTGIVADIVSNVGQDKIELARLLPVGADPHTFEPAPRDLAAVAGAHVIFGNGMGLERFLDSLIENAGGQAAVIHISEGITPRQMNEQHEHDEAEEHEEEAGHAGEEEHSHEGADPHTWTTPANAIVFVNNVEAALTALDPNNAATYRANAGRYRDELEKLDEWVRAQIETIPQENRELVTDHASFGYYADRYGLEQVGAVIPSFSTGAEPSAQELAALEDAIQQYGVKAVFVGTTVNPSLADQVARDTGTRLVTLYTGSLGPEGSGAETYLDYIRYNTQAIVEGLR